MGITAALGYTGRLPALQEFFKKKRNVLTDFQKKQSLPICAEGKSKFILLASLLNYKNLIDFVTPALKGLLRMFENARGFFTFYLF